MHEVDFSKTQGLGNDFVMIDANRNDFSGIDVNALAVRLCDRNFGIGADGLILILPSKKADYRMRILNSDGSEAEMCGNGIRCFGRYLLDHGMGRTPMTVETLAGIMHIWIMLKDARVVGFKVDMGVARLDAPLIPVTGYDGKVVARPLEADGWKYDITCVSMGNPHCVIFTKGVDDIHLAEIGPKIETHPAFPNKTNVEFVEVLNPGEMKVRVWERGAGITQACGTGACASLVAGVLNNLIDRRATVHLPGGDLEVEWSDKGNVYLTGPAEVVFEGKIQI
jgi:diaminopimelate epimerase